MAINFKEINDKLKNSPLSGKELEAVNELEKFIDGKILKEYVGSDFRLNLYQAQFKKTINHQTTDWPDVRKKLMQVELEKRYTAAGWVCKEEYADAHDRFGLDWWVLTGKK